MSSSSLKFSFSPVSAEKATKETADEEEAKMGDDTKEQLVAD